MHDDPTRNPGYISQSECRDAQDCGTRWLATWHHGVRQTTPESEPQIVGSLGHAVLAEHLLSRHQHRDPDVPSALLVECEKRRYDVEIEDPIVTRAVQAAETLLSSPKFEPGAPLTLYDDPLIEQRIRATWADLAVSDGLQLGTLRDIFAGHRLGMEGQPDFGHMRPEAAYFDDFKFRQKADLGGAQTDNALPDQQGAFYKVLGAGAGVRGRLGAPDIVFRQINVYAGPWLTLDDFMVDGSPYVTEHGIPSRDLKVLGMVDPDVWSEAWRLLVERRRVASTHATTTDGKGRVKPKPVRMASPAEMTAASAFVDTLRRTPLVEVSEFRLDHSVCVEVVRDMLAAVAGHLALLRAGSLPGRHLRTYQNAPCSRRYGCPVQAPCLASLGSQNLSQTLAEMAEDGRMRRATEMVRHATVADYDASAVLG